MLLTTCALAAGLSLAPVPQAVQYFPGDYYSRRGHLVVERTALDRWPGPAGLLELWRSGKLAPEQRVALLLGAGAFHDPQLLPVYREALLDRSGRVRAAAAFGVHVLLADGVPGGTVRVDEATGRRLARTVATLESALRSRDLVQVWLQSLLRTEKTALYHGPCLEFDRSLEFCERALDQLLQPEDLPLVMTAYRAARTDRVRTALMRLLGGLAMERFVPSSRKPRTGWNSEIYRIGLRAADRFAERWCGKDVGTIYRRRFLELQASGVDPFAPESGVLWLRTLQRAPAPWWGVAGRMLYRYGAPPLFPSLADPNSPDSRGARESLLRFYGLTHTRKRRLELPRPTPAP